MILGGPKKRHTPDTPCLDGFRPKTRERATIYSLEEVLGWNTSSWRSWVRHLGDIAGGILCARVAALCVTLATPKCSFSSGGDDGPAVCDNVPRRCRRGGSSMAFGSRGWCGNQGTYSLGGLGSQYVPSGG